MVDNAVDILTNSIGSGGSLIDAKACVPYLAAGTGHQFRGSFTELGRMIVGKSFGYDLRDDQRNGEGPDSNKRPEA